MASRLVWALIFSTIGLVAGFANVALHTSLGRLEGHVNRQGFRPRARQRAAAIGHRCVLSATKPAVRTSVPDDALGGQIFRGKPSMERSTQSVTPDGAECVFGCVLDLGDVEESDLDEIVQDADAAISLSAHHSIHAPVLGVVAGVAAIVNFYVNPIVEVIDTSNFVDIERQLTAAAGMQQEITSTYNGGDPSAVDAAVDAGTRGARGLQEALSEAMAFLRRGISSPAADQDRNKPQQDAAAAAPFPPSGRSQQYKDAQVGSTAGSAYTPQDAILRATNAQVNKMLVERVNAIERMSWGRPVVQKDGVKIWASHLGEELTMGWPEGVGPSSGGGKFTATLARGTIETTPDQVFSLFNDNDLVSEYNEFCTEITDVVTLDEDTRITWGATGKVGPFSPRDFVTRCHNSELEGGGMLCVNLGETLPCTEERINGRSSKYVRMEVVIGGTWIRPIDDGKSTEYTVMCLTNPGGAAETAVGSALVNRLSETAPLTHVKAIRRMCKERAGGGK